jgi:plastocyanin
VAGAQSATPAGNTAGITVAAAGLENPRGFTWGSDGTLYVALAGISDTPAAGDATPTAPATAGGLDGSVVYIGDNTCQVMFQGVLPSAGGAGGIDLGPSDVVTVNGQVYVLDEGGGAANGNPLTPDGIYAIDGGGSAVVVADLGAWIQANPVANPVASDDADGDPFAMVTDGTSFWVTETEFGQLLNVTLDGTITRVADFSTGNQVPTGLTFGPDGTLYVALLEGNSLAEGKSSVVSVAADGTTSTVWSGLTAIVAIAAAQDGTLYALQIGTSTTDELANVAPGSGKVVRQTGADTAADVATGFDVPIGLAFGPDGGLYVSSPAFSPSASDGSIVRLNTNQGQVMTMSKDLLTGSPCLPATPTPAPTTVATPATPDTTPDAGSPTAEAPSGSSVEIKDFAFNPASITITTGTTVTWTNNDTVPHTVTAKDGSFDSGTISPGDSFTHTFDAAGSFDYACNFHPNMLGTVVVQ